MEITFKWLDDKCACREGLVWYKNHKETDPLKLMDSLIRNDKLDWANWLIVRMMKRNQYLSYSIYAAEQVIGIFEKEYPNDRRPRQAIDAAKAVLKRDTAENWAASEAAFEAASMASEAASMASWAASEAAFWAAFWASRASEAAKKEMQLRILNYGMSLLKTGA